MIFTDFKPVTFDKWVGDAFPDIDEITRELLAKTWNAALHQACELFGENEGTDYGAEDKLKVK